VIFTPNAAVVNVTGILPPASVPVIVSVMLLWLYVPSNVTTLSLNAGVKLWFAVMPVMFRPAGSVAVTVP
jgi:hypothetical protein